VFISGSNKLHTVFSMRVYVDNTNGCTLQTGQMPTERRRKYIEIRTRKKDFQLQQISAIDNAISLNSCYWVIISFGFSEEFYLLNLPLCTKCRGFETSDVSVKDEKHSRLSGTCCWPKLVLTFGTEVQNNVVPRPQLITYNSKIWSDLDQQQYVEGTCSRNVQIIKYTKL